MKNNSAVKNQCQHTRVKHQIIEYYLGLWYTILANSNYEELLYIDGFAGSGDSADDIGSSPELALKAAYKQAIEKPLKKFKLVFVEIDKKNYAKLSQKIKKYELNNIEIKMLNTDYKTSINNILDDVLYELKTNMPTLVFIDPYGYTGVHFDTIKRILHKEHAEVILILMNGYINRFANQTRREEIEKIFNITKGELENDIKHFKENDWSDLYKKKLETVAKYVKSFVMKNEKKRTIYTFFFASNNLKGFNIMKQAMWGADPIFGSEHENGVDKENNQHIFCDLDVNELSSILSKKFSGKEVTGLQVKNAILESENFIDTQKTKTLQKMESEGKIIVKPLKTDGKKRKPNTYSDITIIKFL